MIAKASWRSLHPRPAVQHLCQHATISLLVLSRDYTGICDIGIMYMYIYIYDMGCIYVDTI